MTAALKPQITPRPFLKWAGGKGRLIEQYHAFFPKKIGRYHEPFLGGGAVFFHLSARCRQSVLADLNEELVNVYCCVRDDVETLIDLLQVHQDRHCHDYYYSMRAQGALRSPTRRAARLVYLNKTCFNGLYRENSKGLFNVPIGRYKNPKICAPELLRSASAALQVADISERPFDAVTEHATSDRDFVYFDPPYHPLSDTSNFTGYSRYQFGEQQQRELKTVIEALSDRNVKVLASNSDCPFIRDLYQGFKVETISAARSINSKASKRGKITEVLLINQ